MPPVLDFPASPTVGQKYPSPAVTGVPVYSWDGEKWTTVGGAIGSTGASDAIPQPDTGTGAAGSSTLWSRGDHAHPLPPTDLTRAPIASPTFTGDPKAPTPAAGDSDTSLATTAFVSGAISTAVGGIPVAPSAVVRYDIAQSLTAPQLIQARQNIYAAPFDAMAYSGLQINGGMEISQERGISNPVAANNAYVMDGWKLGVVGSMVPSASQASNPTFPGLPFFLGVGVPTAQASLGASDLCTIYQPVEGYRTARLQWGTATAQPITVGFWSAHHRTGIYSGSVRNGAANRSFAFNYTHNVADVAQYNTVTVPGDTTGTWASDNTVGIIVGFCLGSGANSIAPTANAWQAGNYIAASGQVNGVASTSDGFRITGVTVHPGNEGPSAARSPFVMRPYDQEWLMGLRYYERHNQIIYRSPPNYYWLPARVQKRAVPTVSCANASYSGTSTPTAANIKVDGAEINFVGTGYIFTDVAFDARL